MRANFTKLTSEISGRLSSLKLVFFFLAFGLLSGTLSAQTISSISPTCATLNQGFTLTINSTNPGTFNKNDARVILNGDQNTPIIPTSANLTADRIVVDIPANRLTQVGGITVQVGNKSGANYTWSNAVTFTVLTTPTVASPAARCGSGPVSLSASGAPTGGSYNWYTSAVSPTAVASGATYSPTISATTTYYVSMTSNGCESARTAVTATVNPIPTAPGVTSAARCGTGTVTLTASGAGTGASYRWYTVSSGGTAIPGATAATYTTPSISTSTTYYVSIVTNATGCESSRVAVTATVNPIPAAPSTTSDSVCRSGQVNLSASGAPAGGDYRWYTTPSGGTPIATGSTFSPSVTATTTYYVATVSAEGCESATRTTSTATVISVPTATVSTNGSPTTFCQGGSISLSAVANPPSGAYTYQWKKDGANITGAVAATYTATATGNYSVIISNEGCQSDESAAVAVTVNPYPVATVSAPNGPTVCQGGKVVLSVEPVTGATYQWQLNGNNITGATATTYDADASGSYRVVVTQNNCATTSAAIAVTAFTPPTASITGQAAFCDGVTTVLTANTDKGTAFAWLKDGNVINGEAANTLTITDGGAYQVRITDANGCFTTSAAFNVTKKPLPVAAITPASALEFCDGGAVVLNASTASGNTYRWFKDGGATPVGTAASLTANTSGSYTVEVTNNGCVTLSSAVNVIVNPNPTATITPTGPTNFCEGNSVVLNAPVAPAGQTYTYEWLKDGSAIGTSQNIEVDESGNYTLKVTTGKGCSVTSAALTVKVQTQAAATITYTGSATFCEGGTLVFAAPQAPAGQQYTYQWLKGGSAIAGATGITYTATASGDYQVTVSNVDADPNLVCSKTSDAVTVNVLPQPIATITSGTEAKCIGANNTTTFAISGDFSGGTAQWSSSSGAFVIQNPVYNTATGKATATVVATGTGTATITLQTSNTTTSCNTATSTVTLTVDPLPVATISAGSATTFCQGGSVILSAPDGPYSYQWFRNGTAAGTGKDYTATTSGDYTVRLTNTTTGCVATSTTATTITVNPQPTVTAAAATASKCVGENNTTIFDLTGTATNGTPAWSTVSSTGTAAVSSFSSPSTGNTQVTVSGIGTVTVRLTSSSTVASCNDATQDVTLTVKPLPIANAGPDMALCVGNNNSTTFDRNASGSAGTVAWTVKSTDGLTVDDLAYPFLQNSFVRVSGIGSAVLTMTITNNGCSTSDDVMITVKPRPTVDVVENKTYCNGAAGEAISFGSSLSGSTYAWTSSTDIGFGTSGSGNIPAYTTINTGTAPIVATVRVTATADECAGPQQTFTITVNPSPRLNSSLTPPAVCSGAVFTYNPTSATAGSTFAWTRAAVAGISNAAGSGAGAVSETLINTTPNPVKVTYVFTSTANNCSGTAQNVEVTVNPTPALNSTLTPAAICSGTNFSYTPTSATAGATFSWTRLAATGITTGAAASGTGSINHTLTNTTSAPIDVTYRYTTTANGCSGTSTQDVVVRVNPTPVLSSTLAPAAICSGTSFSYTPTSATAGATFSWTRLTAAGITTTGAASGTGAIDQVLTNTTTAPVNVTYRFTTTANGCNSATQDVVVRVNPTPVLTSSLTPAAVCSETSFSYTPTSATTGSTFTWTRASVTGISNPAASGTGAISETLVNTTTTDKTVIYVYTITANGCTNTQNVAVTVKPKPTPAITNITDGQIFYSGDANITLIGSPTGSPTAGTFSGPGVVGNKFSPCDAFKSAPAGATEMNVTITYTVSVSGCTASTTRTVKIKKSIYKVIVVANPHPFCQGENVNYKSYVYRDAEIIYPYLTNANGEPVDANGNLIPKGASNFPVWNPAYPFPAGTPQIIKEQGYRYFQPIVKAGTGVLLDNSLFTYQWTKNEQVNRKNDLWETNDAGLSSQDYYGVKVTSKTGAICDAVLADQMSYRMYSADLPDYEVALTVSPNPMCTSGPLTMTATLDGDFNWAMANTKLEFVLMRGSTVYVLNTIAYSGTNPITFTYDPTAIGGFINGDKVQVNLVSDVNQFVSSKCSGKTGSNVIDIIVEQPATVTTDLTAAPIVKCEGETATFSVSGTGTGLQFNWFKDAAIPVTATADGRITIANTTANNITTSTLTITGLLESDEGLYYADLVNTNTTACTRTATTTKQQLIVNALPDAQTMVGGEYCPYDAAGVPLILSDSEAGMSYELLKDGAPMVPQVIMAGTGEALNFGTFTEGNYTVVGTGEGTCVNNSVATATITSTLIDEEVVGNLEFEWVAEDSWKFTALESGLPSTAYSFGPNPEFVWYTKPIVAAESEWKEVARTTDNNITLVGTPPDTEVKVEVYASDKCQMFTMITGAVVPFPVELIEFKATKKGDNVVLNWSTAMEKNNTGFEIQVSENGTQFRKLDFVPTKNGNSSTKLSYTYTDIERNKRQTRYYRLKQIDADGKSEIFGPVSVSFGEFRENMIAYPNPFTADIYLDIETDIAGPMEVTLADVTGKKLLTRIIEVAQGKGTYKIELEPGTPAGAYFIVTRKGDELKHFKLIKQ